MFLCASFFTRIRVFQTLKFHLTRTCTCANSFACLLASLPVSSRTRARFGIARLNEVKERDIGLFFFFSLIFTFFFSLVLSFLLCFLFLFFFLTGHDHYIHRYIHRYIHHYMMHYISSDQGLNSVSTHGLRSAITCITFTVTNHYTTITKRIT